MTIANTLRLHVLDNYISPAEREKLNSFILSHVGPIALSLGTWTGIKSFEHNTFPTCAADPGWPLNNSLLLNFYDVLLKTPVLLVSFYSIHDYASNDTIIIKAVVRV